MIRNITLFALTSIASISTTGAAPLPAKVNAEILFERQLTAINALLVQKRHTDAIRSAVKVFDIDASNCRGIEPMPIEGENGNDVVAHTRMDQIVVLDPRLVAFKNARYLVSILAHEITHCDQNQKMYALALANDPELAPLKKISLLRVLADLDEIANVALGKSPAKDEALKQYNRFARKFGITLSPKRLSQLASKVAEDLQMYQRSLAELHEMEAALRAFETPGVLPAPRAGSKPSPEFRFQYRFLMASTDKLLRKRQLFGAQGMGPICQLSNFVPDEMVLRHERTCHEAFRLLRTFPIESQK